MSVDQHGLSKRGQMAGQTLGFCKHPRTTQNKKRQASQEHKNTVDAALNNSISIHYKDIIIDHNYSHSHV